MTRILVENDLHCGNILGLTPPAYWRADLQAIQRVMWDFREAQLAAIDPVDIHVINGDAVDGPGRKDSLGHLTTDLDLQAEMAIECIERVQAGTRIFTYGSPYHVTAFGNVETAIAKHFGQLPQDTARFQVHGRKFNFRHVVGRSDVPNGQGAQTAKEITRDLLQAILDGHDPADVYGRAHVHYFYMVMFKGRTAFSGPCWELPIDMPGSVYPRTLRTQYYDVGLTLIEVDDTGEIFIRPRIMKLNQFFPKEYPCLDTASPSPQFPKRKSARKP